MLKFYKDYTNKVLRKFGVEIIKADDTNTVLDLRGKALDPIEAYYYSKGRPFVIDVPIEKCSFIEFSGSDKNNPFVQTLIEYGKGSCSSYTNSPLEDFYRKWQPGSSVLYCKDDKELAPPWDYGLKRAINLAEARLKRRDFVRVKKELGLADADLKGHISRGPVSKGFGEVTFNRLVKIYDSIKRHGYHPEKMNADHIRASFLLDHTDYRASISSGKHRITALHALGYKEVPIQFGPPKFPVIIRRNDVDKWPNVRAGYYTKEQALKVFDDKFSDVHPSNWRWQK